jgi:hypothetical protein
MSDSGTERTTQTVRRTPLSGVKQKSASASSPDRAAAVIVYECSGLMFWLTRKKFVGSYLVFKATSRS